MTFDVGFVVIGRNEGERLRRCLASVDISRHAVVYVDSGSTDGSREHAASVGAMVVALSTSQPFTAGRARNEGFRRMRAAHPSIRYVQFVDGDCELHPGWLDGAVAVLVAREDVAIVCGRRRERHPERTVYNGLCDVEWDTPVGEADACGGDFLVRADVFAAIGGFDGGLIAGEEPEMCHRLRKAGWRILRLDLPMTLHDANITSLGQWARRTSRSGYAYAARAMLHFGDGTRYCYRENARIVMWAAAVPATALIAGLLLSRWWLLLLLVYPLQLVRLLRAARGKPWPVSAWQHAWFTMLGKWPELGGLLTFLLRRVRGARQELIEYK